MTRRLPPHSALLILLACIAIVACDKAPRGVIGERQMAHIVADLQLADAYVLTTPEAFATDSAKIALKQSILAKHGVTPMLYDSSLVWYAHNMDAYTDVYDRATNILNKRRAAVEKNAGLGMGAHKPIAGRTVGRRLYGTQGDTVNLWTGPLQMLTPPGLNGAFYPFTYEPRNDEQAGDRYELSFKLNSVGAKLEVLMAVDYSDGSSSLMPHLVTTDGWTTTTVQADTAREVRRIYGYLHHTIAPAGMAMLDTIQLLRTHYNRKSYPSIGVQRLIERK